eukprot:6182933-Pleurochrysis_carterae.AAC.4
MLAAFCFWWVGALDKQLYTSISSMVYTAHVGSMILGAFGYLLARMTRLAAQTKLQHGSQGHLIHLLGTG